MKTFLLSHNPILWDWTQPAVTSRADLIEITATGGTGVEPWSLGTRKYGVEVGDRVLLLRQGPEPRGLIGAGTVSSEPYLREHWDGRPGHEALYVDVEWEEVVSDRDLLPLATLSAEIPDVDWTPRSAGRLLTSAQATAVDRLWRGHLASLRDRTTPREAWLLLAAGDDAQFGGNEGYLDDPAVYYSWDSTVKNHAGPQVGDLIVLWDKESSLGASVIESISTQESTKALRRCPQCGRAKIKSRTTASPRWRCQACTAEFEEPSVLRADVTTYRSDHAAAWVDLANRFSATELRSLCERPRSQHSIRPMIVEKVIRALPELVGRSGTGPLVTTLDRIKGGHTTRTVRARVGQQHFRAALLTRYGAVCAFSGACPPQALEAAHLVSYALTGVHETDRGLLLRRDLHRLFDDGLIAWNPASQTLDVSDDLAEFSTYRSLQGSSLQCATTKQQRDWLQAHWSQHRIGQGG